MYEVYALKYGERDTTPVTTVSGAASRTSREDAASRSSYSPFSSRQPPSATSQ